MTDTPARPDHRSIWTHLHRTRFRQDWVDAGGIDTRYCEAGPAGMNADTPTVLMLHGTASTWEAFCANIPDLSRHYRCLALDMIGSGFSSKPDRDYHIADYVSHILAFMDAMGVRRASIIGVSLGAWIAARMAIDHAERVGRIVLVAPSGMVANTQTMTHIRSVRGKAVDEPTWENIKPIFEGLIHDEADRIDDLVALRQACYRQPEMKQAMAHILCLQDPAIRPLNLIPDDLWRTIQSPTLVWAAPDDRIDFYETALKAARLIPDARMIEVPKVKHWLQFERPQLFNEAVLAFLGE